MGRSRGGLTTKVHALTDARGLPIKLALTPGQAHDVNGAARLLSDLDDGVVLLGDKAYDGDWIRERIERFFNRIKHLRRVATRFEKPALNYLAMIKLASIRIWLRVNESMA